MDDQGSEMGVGGHISRWDNNFGERVFILSAFAFGVNASFFVSVGLFFS